MQDSARAPARKDINEDFPLRGFVACGDCEKPLTANWSTGKTGKKHPYYLCFNKVCESYRKSIPRDEVEGAFERILHSMQPNETMFSVAREMFADAWSQRLAQAKHVAARMKQELTAIEKQTEQLLSRIVENDNPASVHAYETKLGKLEKNKFILAEKLSSKGATAPDLR